MGRKPILDGPDWGCGDGVCACGCGQPTPIARATKKDRGQIFGRHMRFLHGHNGYKNGQTPYRQKGRKREHVVVAERALGKPLPTGAVVHHIDGNGKNNDPSNLVICQDQAYHQLLHQRQRAMDACGDPNAHRCRICTNYERQREMKVREDGSAYHAECLTARNRVYYERRRGQGSTTEHTNTEIAA